MDRAFWQGRWEAGQIGFHEGVTNRFLERHAARVLPADGKGTVFVPLCGKAADLDWLAARGHRVLGCELIEVAARAFFEERGLEPRLERRGDFDCFVHGGVTILVGDVLELTSDAVGPIDAIYDRAALIALLPSDRARYVSVLAALSRGGMRSLLVTLEHDAGSGPPFSIERPALEELYGGAFTFEQLEREDVTRESDNITRKGATRVAEIAYALVRR